MKTLFLLLSVLFFSFANATPSDTVIVSIGNVAKSSTIHVVDKQTGADIGAIVSNVVIQNSNPEFATVATSVPGSSTIVISPVASGSGTATVSCHVIYTDPGDGLSKSEDRQIVILYTVVYNPPHGVTLKLTF